MTNQKQIQNSKQNGNKNNTSIITLSGYGLKDIE